MITLRTLLVVTLGYAFSFASSASGQFVDTDNDRIDDNYETTHGLLVGSDDRYGDLDGDGFPNLAEYLKSTSASSDASVPTADRVVGAGETYTTISSAISSLSADDQIIVVKPGTYTGALSSTSKRVFIISESVDPNATTINGASSTVLSSTKDLYLRGFTLTGTGSYGVSLTGSGYYGIVQCILRGPSYGIYSYPSSSSVRNYVDVIGTVIQAGAWGIYGYSNSSTFRLVHTTIYGNSSYAVYSTTNNGGGSTYTLTNCVMWPNGSTPFSLSGTTLTATYSCIKGSMYSGTGNINGDPLLVQGYLGSTSPCVDAGTSAALVPSVPEDVRGDARSIGSGPDIGAHEYQTGGSWAGDFDGDGLSDIAELSTYGSSFASSDTDSDRIDDGYEATHGLSILVDDRYGDADGDGYPNLAEYLKSTSASSDASVPTADRVVGAGETYTTISSAISSLSADDQIIVVKPGTYTGALSSTSKRVFIISESVDPNATTINGASSTVLSSTKDLYLRGFTLTGTGSYGVSLTGSGHYGIVQCILRGPSYGIYSYPSSSSVRNYVDVIGTVIQAGAWGIYGYSNSSTFRLVHTTIYGNSSYAIYSPTNNGGGSTYTLTNCVMWPNGSTPFYLTGTGTTLTATYSCIKGSIYSGTGNINGDPLLVQGYLGSTSPCVDAGTSAALVPSVPEDVRGDARSIGSGPGHRGARVSDRRLVGR
jgi:hypothetical protein